LIHIVNPNQTLEMFCGDVFARYGRILVICFLSIIFDYRYCRLRNYNTSYICGADEYGLATETRALHEKCTPREICDKYFDLHSSIYQWFQLEFDFFGRTSTQKQTEYD
jgi:methionyl-tRNA synthetase